MLKIEIYDHAPANMLRAIRAACNELLGETDLTTQAAEHNSRAVQLHAAAEAETDKAAAALSAHLAAEEKHFLEGEQAAQPVGLAVAFDKAVETAGAPAVAAGLLAEQSIEVDSAGQMWNAELHSSSRAKIADGTWKKRRNVGGSVPATPVAEKEGEEAIVHSTAALVPAAPPVPPAPTAPIMPKIFALITSQIVTINQAVEAAQAEGFADLGANGLGGAPVEKQLAVLRKLEAA